MEKLQDIIVEKYLPEYSIHRIIKELKAIVIETQEQNPNLSYFAILYMYVTIQISKEISFGNSFEDKNRMERLDVIFALRYIDAYKNWKKGEPISKSWQVAFDFGKNENSMIMQHLLLGMNAHINLDLAIATVEATSLDNNHSLAINPYYNFNSIIKDFSEINEVLNKLTKTVEKSLAESSYFFGLILKYGKNKEDVLANFSVKYARTGAWYFASSYCKNRDENTIEKRDNDISDLARQIIDPNSKLIQFLLNTGSFFERKSAKNFIPTMISKLDEFVGVEFDYI